MSRLYEIIRQMEERSSAAPPISHQKMLVISTEKDSSKKRWWRFYRTVILVFIITILATITITLGPKILTTSQTKKSSQVAHINVANQTNLHQARHKGETPNEKSTAPAIDKMKPEKTERSPNLTSAQTYSSQDGTKGINESKKEEPSNTPATDVVITTTDSKKGSEKDINSTSASRETPSKGEHVKPTQKTELDKAANIARTPSLEKKTVSVPNSSMTINNTHSTNEDPVGSKRTRNLISESRSTHSTSTSVKPPQKSKITKANVENTSQPEEKNAPVPHAPPANISPPTGMIVIAEEARQRGDIDEALDIYKQYLALHRDPYAMNNLGALLILKGRFSEAEEILQEAFQLVPTDGDIAANLIGVEMMIGKLSQACEILSRFKKGTTNVPQAIKALEPYLGNCQ